ncbi:MAG: hypothetical protein IPM56_06600 [Ignavibacteriales bacterium]|nr:MAG: hypothetical protein IPM56_06600 [Ignavibacteriales bacterium]
MKYFSFLIIFLALTIIGCNDNSDSLTGSDQNQPGSLLKLPGSHEFSISRLINGDLGGELLIDTSYAGGPFDTVKIHSHIVFPPNSFDGEVNISMTIEGTQAVLVFEPSMMFDSSATLNVRFDGLDLTGVNPSTINFVYLNDDGTTNRVNRKDLKVVYGLGRIQLVDGNIPHFTRLGFTR